MKKEIKTYSTPDALATAAADFFLSVSQQAIKEKGRFFVALSGGSTPRRLFKILSSEPYKSSIDWNNCFIFFGDERYVPHDHPDSNYRTAKETLLDHVSCPSANIFAANTDGVNANEDAAQYEKTIYTQLGTPPEFDLIYLGLGPDGHTASLFPDTTALQENNKQVAAVYVDKLASWRITFTYPLLSAARHVMFLVEGEAKAQVLKEILVDEDMKHPAQGVKARQILHWYLDQQAASKLKTI